MKKVNIKANGKKVPIKLKGIPKGASDLTLERVERLGKIRPYIAFDTRNIHKTFANLTSYMICIPGKSSINPINKIKEVIVCGIESDSFDQMTDHLIRINDRMSNDAQFKDGAFYIYFPDTKYIMVLRQKDVLVIDYGHFNHTMPGDTLVYTLRGVNKPIDTKAIVSDSAKILDTIKHASELFEQSYKLSGSNSHLCLYCHKTSEEVLKICSRCRTAYYCNETCQKADWSLHKQSCNKV